MASNNILLGKKTSFYIIIIVLCFRLGGVPRLIIIRNMTLKHIFFLIDIQDRRNQILRIALIEFNYSV